MDVCIPYTSNALHASKNSGILPVSLRPGMNKLYVITVEGETGQKAQPSCFHRVHHFAVVCIYKVRSLPCKPIVTAPTS